MRKTTTLSRETHSQRAGRRITRSDDYPWPTTEDKDIVKNEREKRNTPTQTIGKVRLGKVFQKQTTAQTLELFFFPANI